MSLRFAILKRVGEKQSKIELEYDQEKIKAKLAVAMKEILISSTSNINKKFNLATVDKAFKAGFDRVVSEFKDDTITLP